MNSNDDKDFDEDDFGMQEALQQGRMEGIQAGETSGFQEGRRLGQVTGVNYGMELGFAMGMVEAVQEWIINQQQQQQQQQQHAKKKNYQVLKAGVVNEMVKTGVVQRHIRGNSTNNSDGDNSEFIQRIEKTVQNLTQAIREFPTSQDLFRCQPPSTSSNDGIITTAFSTTTMDNDSTSSMTQNEVDDIRQRSQRIRTLCKLLATKLGMPHHSLSSVLQRKQQQQQPPTQPIKDFDTTLMTATTDSSDNGLNNRRRIPQQYPTHNKGGGATEWTTEW
jgi:hypothetical protein